MQIYAFATIFLTEWHIQMEMEMDKHPVALGSFKILGSLNHSCYIFINGLLK